MVKKSSYKILSLRIVAKCQDIRQDTKSILKEIQSGKFSKEWVKEYQAGLPKYNKLLEDGEKHPIEVTGQRLRQLMSWIPKKNIKGAQASYS